RLARLPVRRRAEVGIELPRRHLGQLVPGGADRERLELLALPAADRAELLGKVVEPGVAHRALELGEPLGRLALAHQRMREQLGQRTGKKSGTHGGNLFHRGYVQWACRPLGHASKDLRTWPGPYCRATYF